MRWSLPFGVMLAAFGCAERGATPAPPANHVRAEPPKTAASQQVRAEAPGPSDAAASVSSTASPDGRTSAKSAVPRVDPVRARARLPASRSSSCAGVGDDAALVRCLVGEAFEGHSRERAIALTLFDATGDVVAVEEEQTLDGTFRGTIRLVPELPVGTYARHLAWVASAQTEILGFLRDLEAQAPGAIRYRHRALLWKFFRSVGRTTPSAYAANWEVGYNVAGSLHASEAAVRETIFHEVFHLNDQAHGGWSTHALGPLVARVVARCGTKTPCLAPYAPGTTIVRGGTYYAFQPDNGDMANEYGAELATRYFREQRAALRGVPLRDRPFKCRTPENAEAMRALAEEFFGGIDFVPPC